MSPGEPEVSIVIPCRNAASTIVDQIEAVLLACRGISAEVVVADNGSSDSLRDVLRPFVVSGTVRLVDASRAIGINVARNEGVSAARGTFILLCDADDRVHADWAIAHLSRLRAGVTCTGGSLVWRGRDGRIIKRTSDLFTQYSNLPTPMGANCGFARLVFDKIGGFDESFVGGGDETDFFWRAIKDGFRVAAVPDAWIDYRVRDTPKEVLTSSIRGGIGSAHLYSKHSDVMQRRALIRVVASALRSVFGIAFPGIYADGRREAWHSLGLALGRWVGSWRYRVFFP